MAIASANAVWKGTLKEGKGIVSVGSGFFKSQYTWASRFAGDADAANPEELIGAAHAGCFSMFLSAQLTKAGFTPTSIVTHAKVHLGDGPTINKIELDCEAVVPGCDKAKFDELVDISKKGCPVSKALAAVPDVSVKAILK